jgi:hypothetical protein
MAEAGAGRPGRPVGPVRTPVQGHSLAARQLACMHSSDGKGLPAAQRPRDDVVLQSTLAVCNINGTLAKSRSIHHWQHHASSRHPAAQQQQHRTPGLTGANMGTDDTAASARPHTPTQPVLQSTGAHAAHSDMVQSNPAGYGHFLSVQGSPDSWMVLQQEGACGQVTR